jgi:hypothetical protein
MRQRHRQGGGGQLGLAEMDMLYGRARKVTSEPEQFGVKVRRLHAQGLKAANVAFMLNVDLEDVIQALRQDVQP